MHVRARSSIVLALTLSLGAGACADQEANPTPTDDGAPAVDDDTAATTAEPAPSTTNSPLAPGEEMEHVDDEGPPGFEWRGIRYLPDCTIAATVAPDTAGEPVDWHSVELEVAPLGEVDVTDAVAIRFTGGCDDDATSAEAWRIAFAAGIDRSTIDEVVARVEPCPTDELDDDEQIDRADPITFALERAQWTLVDTLEPAAGAESSSLGAADPLTRFRTNDGLILTMRPSWADRVTASSALLGYVDDADGDGIVGIFLELIDDGSLRSMQRCVADTAAIAEFFNSSGQDSPADFAVAVLIGRETAALAEVERLRTPES